MALHSDATVDDLVGVVEENRVCTPYMYVYLLIKKIDQISFKELDIINKVTHCVPISAHHCWNFDDLLEKIWNCLKTSEDLHQTQRPIARLYVPSGAALLQDHGGGYLHEDSQKSYQKI